MTFKWSLDEILFWKETFDEWNCFIFLNKHWHLYSPVKVNSNFLPSNRNEARTYSALKIKIFQMMFIVWRSVLKGLYLNTLWKYIILIKSNPLSEILNPLLNNTGVAPGMESLLCRVD